MTKCSRCGSTSVEWGKTKAGHSFLVEVRPAIPHSRFCPEQDGKLGKKASPLDQAKLLPRSARSEDAIAFLVGLGWKVRESEAAVDAVAKDCTGDLKELVRVALKATDEVRKES